MKKQAMPIQLDQEDRDQLEKLADQWGLSLSGAVRRLIRESKND